MFGSLFLFADPVEDLEAATKQYVDAHSGADPGKYIYEGYHYTGSGDGTDYSASGAGAGPTALDRQLLGVVAGDALGSSSFTAGQDRAWTFKLGRTGNVDEVAIECSATAAGGALARIGIYTNVSQTRRYPGTLVFDTGTFDLSTTGLKTTTPNVTLTTGNLYWVIYNTNSATPTMRNIPAASVQGWGAAATGTTQKINNLIGFTRTRTFGAFPDPYPSDATAVGYNAVTPAVTIHFST